MAHDIDTVLHQLDTLEMENKEAPKLPSGAVASSNIYKYKTLPARQHGKKVGKFWSQSMHWVADHFARPSKDVDPQRKRENAATAPPRLHEHNRYLMRTASATSMASGGSAVTYGESEEGDCHAIDEDAESLTESEIVQATKTIPVAPLLWQEKELPPSPPYDKEVPMPLPRNLVRQPSGFEMPSPPRSPFPSAAVFSSLSEDV